MLKKPIVAANWKMNLNPEEAASYFDEFLKVCPAEKQSHFVFFPPTIDLFVAANKLTKHSIMWGAQNVHTELSGAFTGETSASMLKNLGGSCCLVGHSERRTLFAETDEIVSQKIDQLQSLDITPIICIGESLVQRESGKTQDILADQLQRCLKKINVEKDFILAYEPVWAIGTGKVATPQLAEGAHVFVRYILEKMFSKEVANKTQVLYGGSVNAENVGDMAKQKNIDGFLVGGASLKVDSLMSILERSETSQSR